MRRITLDKLMFWSLTLAAYFLLIYVWVVPQGLGADSGKLYPENHEIDRMLRKVASDHPDWARFEPVGRSYLGREINMLTLGYQHPQASRPQIPILINSAHHGDEKISVKVVLGLIDFIRKSYAHPGVQSLLKDFCFYLVPLVNPDGYSQGTRANAQGIDINRDYFGADGLSEKKELRFETPEARHLNRLMARLSLAGALALHSGAEAIYWPLGESPNPPRDGDVFKKISGIMAESMGLTRVMQSFFDYPTQGEFIDYAYKRFGVLGVTLEVSNFHQPEWSEVDPIIFRSIKGILVYAKALAEHRLGQRGQAQPVPQRQFQVSTLTDLVLPKSPKS